jgi:hypothetical protein
MIDVKHAAQVAVQYCGQLFGNISNRLQLEEVELSDDEKQWFITVGYDEPVTSPASDLEEMLQRRKQRRVERKYKVVHVDTKTGKVKAVKMRQPLERVS